MSDDTTGQDGFDPSIPASLLPYDVWLENAQREVMLKALDYVSEHGLPGDHHFYMTFLTNMPDVDIPARLKERYPEEMTIVLQHQFQNLRVNRQAQSFSVGLSFGGIPSTLHIPFRAITAFADPHVHLILRFNPHHKPEDGLASADADEQHDSTPAEVHDFRSVASEHKATSSTPEQGGDSRTEGAEVVSLAAFRKKPSGESSESPDDRQS